MIWCVYVACVLQLHSRQSQEPKWWMKRGFCLIIGIINFSIPPAQPGQQITVCCPTTDTHQQLSSDGIYSREIWKVNNVLQLLKLSNERIWKDLNQFVTSIVHLCWIIVHFQLLLKNIDKSALTNNKFDVVPVHIKHGISPRNHRMHERSWIYVSSTWPVWNVECTDNIWGMDYDRL